VVVLPPFAPGAAMRLPAAAAAAAALLTPAAAAADAGGAAAVSLAAVGCCGGGHVDTCCGAAGGTVNGRSAGEACARRHEGGCVVKLASPAVFGVQGETAHTIGTSAGGVKAERTQRQAGL
jgi:hypothetical protein